MLQNETRTLVPREDTTTTTNVDSAYSERWPGFVVLVTAGYESEMWIKPGW